jgi:hypothetical protein
MAKLRDGGICALAVVSEMKIGGAGANYDGMNPEVLGGNVYGYSGTSAKAHDGDSASVHITPLAKIIKLSHQVPGPASNIEVALAIACPSEVKYGS